MEATGVRRTDMETVQGKQLVEEQRQRGKAARMRHARHAETLDTYGYLLWEVDWGNAPLSFEGLYGIPAPAGLPEAALAPRAGRKTPSTSARTSSAQQFRELRPPNASVMAHRVQRRRPCVRLRRVRCVVLRALPVWVIPPQR